MSGRSERRARWLCKFRAERTDEHAFRQQCEAVVRGAIAEDDAAWREIERDVTRICAWQCTWSSAVRRSVATILYVWVVSEPVVGYAQAMCHLMKPIVALFMSDECVGARLETMSDLAFNDAFRALDCVVRATQRHYDHDAASIAEASACVAEVLDTAHPGACAALERAGVPLVTVVSRWVPRLFVDVLPARLLWRVWDRVVGAPDEALQFARSVCCALLLLRIERIEALAGDTERAWLLLGGQPLAPHDDDEDATEWSLGAEQHTLHRATELDLYYGHIGADTALRRASGLLSPRRA
jgi:hypothetical protein